MAQFSPSMQDYVDRRFEAVGREFALLKCSIDERFSHVKEVSDINKESAREARVLAENAQAANRDDTKAVWAIIVAVAGTMASLLIAWFKH